MSALVYKAIDPERLDAMRGQGADEFGNPWKPRTAEGWEPLRCCLRTAREGEDIALISYSPWPLPWDTPWAEAGPVFVCHQRCAGLLRAVTRGVIPLPLGGTRRLARCRCLLRLLAGQTALTPSADPSGKPGLHHSHLPLFHGRAMASQAGRVAAPPADPGM